MNHNKLFVTIVAVLALVLAFSAVSADSEAGGSDATLSLSTVEYDNETKLVTISGETTLTKAFQFVITNSEDQSSLDGFVPKGDIKDGLFESKIWFDQPDGEYTIRVYEGPVDSILEDSKSFWVSSAKVSVDRDSVTVTEGSTVYVKVTVDKCTYNDLSVTASNGNVSIGKIDSEGRLSITGVHAGNASVVLEIKETGYSKAVSVAVDKKPLPPPPTEIKEFTFRLSMDLDFDKVDWGTSGLSEDDLRAGIILKGKGTNAGEALESICDASGIPNEFISTHDGNNNDLRYWVVQIFGLRDVPLDRGDWKYWIQEHDGTYNQKSLGWYTDNSGVYTLRYGITSVDYGNEVERIYVKEQPAKTEYKVGESFDPSGMVVMADMSIGEDLQIQKYDVSPKTFTVIGDQSVILTYNGKSTTVAVTVTGGSSPVVPPVIPDIPLDDEKTETSTEKNEDGSTTTTTTTTGKTEDGKDVEIKEVVKTQEDGSSEGTKTQTVTGKEGTKTESTTNTVKDKNGNVTETVTGTSTDADGNVTKVDSVSELDKDGNGKTESTTKIINKDGSTMTKKMSAEKSKDGTEINESVVAESKDGNVRTETISKVGMDGNVQAESKTTVKSGSKDIGADVIEDALKQSEQALSGTSADKSKAKKTIEVEVSSGTSAALSPEAVKKVSDYGAGLKVSVSEGSIDTDSDVLRNLVKDGKTVELSMEANNRDVLKDKQKDIVGDNHFVDLNALVGGENVHQLGGKAVITFGYQLKDGESVSDLKVYYVDDDGVKTLVDATYADGHFTMTVDHFSVYMVENVPSDDGGISPVLIAGIIVVIIAAIAVAVVYTRKH